MIKKLLAISLFTLSCFAANPGRTVTLDTRPTLTLNTEVSSSLANKFAHQKIHPTSVDSDINRRMLGSFLTGFAGAGLTIALAKTTSYSPMKINLLSWGMSLPLVGFTYYPGSTKYDNSSFGDWALISLTRGFCNGLAFSLGFFSSAALGLMITN